ncbi:MAG: Hsp70 family protein [Thermodesulfobacteriota bacterium]
MNDLESLRKALYEIRDGKDGAGGRFSLVQIARGLPKSPESLPLYKLAFSLLDRIEDPVERRTATLDLVREVPTTEAFRPFYLAVAEAAVTAADALESHHQRITELIRLAEVIPATPELQAHRLRACRLALGLPDAPRFAPVSLEAIAKDLPKSLDEAFYRRYTFLGIAKRMPKEGAFVELYKEAIGLAIDAALVITEPFYRRYALQHIAGELPADDAEYAGLYKRALTEAYNASVATRDPFARQRALLDMVQLVPKTPDFFPLLQEILGQALAFFTVKKWMGDMEVLDVVDYILSAEELGIKESKKKRFSREKYASILSTEIEKFATRLNDTRFVEILKPYTHVWIQPRNLRDSVKKVVDHLTSLENTFHGREVCRPEFVSEVHTEGKEHYIHRKEQAAADCISIDLGATNTVIMRRRGDAGPDFVALAPISKQFERMHIVPTVLGAETNTIGMEVNEENPVVNIKQMLLEGNPNGRAHMERFFKVLYAHLKKATQGSSGWFSLLPRNLADTIYITVPVGYRDYRETMREIALKSVKKGTKVEFIEEPLAAAVGYEVVDRTDRLIMVIDFGGSTLNTMVLRLNINELHIVAKPERAQILGGYDIDVWLAEYLAEKASIAKEKIPSALIYAAEKIKIDLSRSNEVPFEWEGRKVCTVSRDELEEVLDRHDFYRFIDRTVIYVLKRAEKVGVKKDRIEAVLLTGGSSQIPSFKEKIADIFPELRAENRIYDHSPLSAVGLGAALYGTRDITDRHLGMAYALRYTVEGKDVTHSFSIVLEKGETLPFEKTYRLTPARRLGEQKEIYLELFEVPESMLTRVWVMESGIEFLKQELKHNGGNLALDALKGVTIPFDEPIGSDVLVTFCIDETGHLSIRYGPDDRVLDSTLRLQ